MLKFKISLLLLGTVSFLTTIRSQAQTSSFNFSLTPHPVSGWINAQGNPGTTVISVSDPATGFAISSIAAQNWSGGAADDNGADGGTFFPSPVMKNHWFQLNGTLSGYNAAIPQLEISGLNRDSVYTLRMTGSFTYQVPQTYNLNPIHYTVIGAVVYGYIDVNGNYNTSDGAVFHNVAPDINGKIRVYVNTYGESNTASISGLEVITGRTTAPMPVVTFIRPQNNDVIPEDGNVSISVQASIAGGSIARVEFYADTTLLGIDSTAPYNILWVSPDEGKYTLRARAIDGMNNIATASVNVSVESLSSFWSMTGNIAANADSNFLGTVDTNRLAFRTNNVERMSILADGTVGIGTKTTQGYKLAVNGNAIFTRVRIKAYENWPDYVFCQDYPLPDLKQVDSFIKTHKHLPGITTADEASKEGLDLATQQAQLLKKVEELTLYAIEEHKQVEELKTQVARLMQQNQTLRKKNQRPVKKANK